MANVERTFRNHFLSIFQSAAADIARQQSAPISAAVASRRGRSYVAQPAAEIEADAAEAAEEYLQQKFGPASASFSTGQITKSCAELGLRYLDARLSRDAAELRKVKADFTAGKCDPAWATTIEQYLKYFGPDGLRRDIPYVKAADAGEEVIEIKPDAKIALVADWGTGSYPAASVIKQIAEQLPDIFVHLGDIYYSGTPAECDLNFQRPITEALGKDRDRLPVYTLSGNHDMYCGGVGYYDLISKMNPGLCRQRASFFCLRASDLSWQLLAMDTALHDFSPFNVDTINTFLDADELAWHKRRVREFPGKTILLSHHQLFSAFSPIGEADKRGVRSACNPHLLAAFGELQSLGKIAAWFWGHEHALTIYQPFAGLARGRCIGHGAVPVFLHDDISAPVMGLAITPQLAVPAKLRANGATFAHGFAMLTLARGDAPTVHYYQDFEGKSELIWRESLE